MLLLWTENLSVGIKEFDDDHKRLIFMINELHHVVQQVDNQGHVAPDEIEIALHRLENHFKSHCLREEDAMAQTNYPGLQEHRREHASFLERVTEMAARFHGSASAKDAMEIMNFIYGWVTDHIYVTDKQYYSHLHNREFILIVQGLADAPSAAPKTT